MRPTCTKLSIHRTELAHSIPGTRGSKGGGQDWRHHGFVWIVGGSASPALSSEGRLSLLTGLGLWRNFRGSSMAQRPQNTEGAVPSRPPWQNVAFSQLRSTCRKELATAEQDPVAPLRNQQAVHRQKRRSYQKMGAQAGRQGRIGRPTRHQEKAALVSSLRPPPLVRQPDAGSCSGRPTSWNAE
jgi:hypothetical protein